MNREMQRALEADGEKLRQLTGEDHGPWEIVTCEACDGRGFNVVGVWVHEPGCGYGHDSTDEIRCDKCLGIGYFVQEAEGRPLSSTK